MKNKKEIYETLNLLSKHPTLFNAFGWNILLNKSGSCCAKYEKPDPDVSKMICEVFEENPDIEEKCYEYMRAYFGKNWLWDNFFIEGIAVALEGVDSYQDLTKLLRTAIALQKKAITQATIILNKEGGRRYA